MGKDEIDNLELAQFIAKVQNKDLNYEMVDFHSQRPGHDLRYSLTVVKLQIWDGLLSQHMNNWKQRLIGL